MALKCEWCGGIETPFTKLNIENYGENKFICQKCYQEIEQSTLTRLTKKERALYNFLKNISEMWNNEM